jgi:hypothetical protein
MDTLETGNYFASPVYYIDKPEFLEAALEVFNEYVECSCDKNELYPSIMTGNMSADERLQTFSKYIINTGWNILDTQGYRMEDKMTYFHSMWGQQHEKFGSMEEHIHNDSVQIVGFYFLECPENCPKMVVHDPRQGKIQIGLAEKDAKSVTPATNAIIFEPKPGALFFTNAWLPHSFTRNGSDTPFKFIHINISVAPAIKTQEAIVI